MTHQEFHDAVAALLPGRGFTCHHTEESGSSGYRQHQWNVAGPGVYGDGRTPEECLENLHIVSLAAKS